MLNWFKRHVGPGKGNECLDYQTPEILKHEKLVSEVSNSAPGWIITDWGVTGKWSHDARRWWTAWIAKKFQNSAYAIGPTKRRNSAQDPFAIRADSPTSHHNCPTIKTREECTVRPDWSLQIQGGFPHSMGQVGEEGGKRQTQHMSYNLTAVTLKPIFTQIKITK